MRLAALVAAVALAATPVPTPFGASPRFRPPPAAHGPCVSGNPAGRFRAHVELFAHARAILVPTGIGVRAGCRARVRTLDPTGVVYFDDARLTLGDLFAVWGQPLSRHRLLPFRGAVRVYVRGRRTRVDPRIVALHDRRQIVVEVGPYVPPHASYLFPRTRR